MKVPASIKRLRDVAPRSDWNSEALRPSKRPNYGTWATTENKLRRDLRRHGEAAVLYARASSALRWLMDDVADKLDCSRAVAIEAVGLLREEILRFEELPKPDGQPWPGIYHRISNESQDEARSVAASVFRAWIDAGKPYHTEARIADAHQYVLACVRGRKRTAEQADPKPTEDHSGDNPYA